MVAMEELLPQAVLRQIGDKLYEKRKVAALEVEQIVKRLAAVSDTAKISAILDKLIAEYAFSAQANHRKVRRCGIWGDTDVLCSLCVQTFLAQYALLLRCACIGFGAGQFDHASVCAVHAEHKQHSYVAMVTQKTKRSIAYPTENVARNVMLVQQL
jgi:hypothetical protein